MSAPAQKANTRAWHPLQQLRDQKLAPHMVSEDHVDTTKGFFMDLAIAMPKCISKTGKKILLSCNCLQILEDEGVAESVAFYAIHFAQKKRVDQEAIVAEWIRYTADTPRSNLNQGHCIFRLPFLDPGGIDDSEQNLLTKLRAHRMCQSSLMHILDLGRKFWTAAKNMAG